MGVVNRVVWDSSCNLCPDSSADVTCLPDRSGISCVDGECKDCYAQLRPNKCTPSSKVCTPHVYVAWVGTDRYRYTFRLYLGYTHFRISWLLTH